MVGCCMRNHASLNLTICCSSLSMEKLGMLSGPSAAMLEFSICLLR